MGAQHDIYVHYAQTYLAITEKTKHIIEIKHYACYCFYNKYFFSLPGKEERAGKANERGWGTKNCKHI